MLRFPNPGSDIDSFLRIFYEIFESLISQSVFDLDDITKTLIARNLATSCGYMGDEALQRSTRPDRSRDPLYNQSKMYSELYKILGWIHPTYESALQFRFTYLGAHVYEAQIDPNPIFCESILGIAYPNSILNVRFNNLVRPFLTFLRTIDRLEGIICRDELIIGPYCLENDRDDEEFESMINDLRSIRGDYQKLINKIKAISVENGIAFNTMQNYTRFPLAVLLWTEWTNRERNREVYHRSIPFYRLTDFGLTTLNNARNLHDVRATDLDYVDLNVKDAVTRLAFYQMLQRSNFNIDPVKEQMKLDVSTTKNMRGNSEEGIIFSPFQELNSDYVISIFPDVSGSIEEEKSGSIIATSTEVSINSQLLSKVTIFEPKEGKKHQFDEDLIIYFESIDAKSNNLNQFVDLAFDQFEVANQDSFYPVVAILFRALGYHCEHSRPGVHYQRYDALIIDDVHSIPIEIKSPGEEEYISIKAIRQALENKVILLSRKPFPTQMETTSLVVGYRFPNNRSEVMSLISDIYNAFNIRIGVIDFRSLLKLAAANYFQNQEHNVEELIYLHGFIEPTNAETKHT